MTSLRNWRRVWSVVGVLSLVAGFAVTAPRVYGQATPEQQQVAIKEMFEARTVPSFPRPTAAEAKILQSLGDPADVDWTDKPLEEALNDLEDMHGIEIWIDKQSLQDEGIGTDQQVTLQLKGTPLRSCFKLLLEPLGLVYAIEDEVLKITTTTTHATTSVTRVYPVGDLCATADDAKQLLETLECGLGLPRDKAGIPRLVISAKMKTLTVRDSYVVQEKVQELILALRDAQAVNMSLQGEIKPEQPLAKPRPI